MTSTRSDRLPRWFEAAAGPHCRLLQGPQPGRRLAGVEDPGGRVGRRTASTNRRVRRGHARQVTEEVERRALGGEDRAQRAGHLGHDRPGRHRRAVGAAASRPRRGSTWANASTAHRRPGQHPGRRGPRSRAGPRRRAGHERGGQVTERQRCPRPAPGPRPRATASDGGSTDPTSAGPRRRSAARPGRRRRGSLAVDQTATPLGSRLGILAPGVGARGSPPRASAAPQQGAGHRDQVGHLTGARRPAGQAAGRGGHVGHAPRRPGQRRRRPRTTPAPSVMARCRRSRALADVRLGPPPRWPRRRAAPMAGRRGTGRRRHAGDRTRRSPSARAGRPA